MYKSTRWFGRRARWLCFTLMFLSAGAVDVAQLTAADSVPSWKQGISAWGGNGYAIPPKSAKAKSDVKTASAESYPYTVPVDPAVAAAQANAAVGKTMSNDLAWLESFASSDVVAARATVGNGPAQAAPVAQVAAQGSPYDEPPLNLGVLQPGEIDSITQRIQSGADVEASLPLQQEVTRWYQYPWIWMSTGWTNHAELGFDASDGNAKTTSLTTGLEMKRKTDLYTLGLDLDYRQASNRGESTQDNGRFNLDYDRILGDSKWSAFAKFGMEWDQFKAFDLRLSTNAGLGYYWVKDPNGLFITRFGAGASKELGAPDESTIPEAVFGAEYERQITERQKIKGKIDYFPSWEDYTNYRLVADASWEILLDGADNLSLKLSVTDRYDSTPQGALPNDVYYSALILYKF